MKYIKSYEHTIEEDNSPQIGDYVICENENLVNNIEINKYTTTHIGRIMDIEPNSIYQMYIVRYEKVPDYLTDSFFSNEEDNKLNDIIFLLEEILFFSPNKKDLKLRLLTNKFNL